MKAGIIAAGQGTRLAAGGIKTPKPLVAINGEPMIARMIRMAAESGASSAACIVNDLTADVAEFLDNQTWPVALETVVRTTPNSMESLFHLAPLLRDEPFLMFTVDAVFELAALKAFLSQSRMLVEKFPKARGVLALTDHVDDEKPLWALTDANRQIVALGDDALTSSTVTAGFYYFDPSVFDLIATARKRKLSALRQFLGLLIENDYFLYGAMVSKTVDVDYPEDIAKAEAFLGERRHEF